MKQVFIRNGRAVVEDVPAPRPEPGEVLVRVRRSCISVGTEMSGLQATNQPIWKRALTRPDKVVKALNMMATRGVAETMNIVKGQINAGLVVGYSAAGTVAALGDGVDDLEVGDRVACAGAQAAHHAEIIRVPRNLTVAVPDAVSFDDAATVTVGAIALQGVRRAAPTLGETFVVVGLGLIGQLTVQMLKANGCNVIGIDVAADRVARAEELGLDIGLLAGAEPPVRDIGRLTGGVGADGAIVTAAARDPRVLGDAFKLCRRKGRVVLVGDVPIEIDRADIYRNEIDFRISTSYGPGRYDRRYEEEGLDYPVSYVRWTENRNMQAYLDLIAQGKVTPGRLIDKVFPVDEAPAAYASLDSAESDRPLGVTLAYDAGDAEFAGILAGRRIQLELGLPKRDGPVQVGVVGPGSFLQSVHLPNMAAMDDAFQIRGVMSRTAHAAKTVAANQRAAYATTDIQELLADTDIELIMIGARHDAHGRCVLDALRAGKHVFVEKPLTIDEGEFAAISDFYGEESSGKPLLLTGFNRRFAPGIDALQQELSKRDGPLMASYRMNAGYIPLDNWVHGAEGGGRNLGEACHIYDLFTALTDARVVSVTASGVSPQPGQRAVNDNFAATLRFDDGSVCDLIYTALGDSSWPKERMEVYCDQKVFELDDYVRAARSGEAKPLWSGSADKGHAAEIAKLHAALRKDGPWPIPLWQQLQATDIAFRVERALSGRGDGGPDGA